MGEIYPTAAVEIAEATPTGVADETAVITDELKNMDWNTVQRFLITNVVPFLLKVVLCFVVFFIGKKVVSLLEKLLTKAFRKAKLDTGISTFIISLVKIAFYILIVFGLLEIIGIGSATVIAVIGSAGLTIGLAFQGSLSNFAGGVLILLVKPFKAGDYIIVGANEGTVIAIDIFYTHIRTADNKITVIPNGTLSNSVIVNSTHEKKRRLDIVVSASYNSDIEKVKTVLYSIVKDNELVLQNEEMKVYVSEYASSSVNYILRFWVEPVNFWNAKFQVTESVKKEFDRFGIEIPYNKLDVNILNKNQESE